MNRFFKDDAVVLFQGDSVTDCGRNRKLKAAKPGPMTKKSAKALGEGYPMVFKQIYDALFPGNKVTFVNRAVSGDKAEDLVRRFRDDFVKVKPDFISILIGVNDTWRDFDSHANQSPEQFRDQYKILLEGIKQELPDAQVLVIEQFACTSWEGLHDWQANLDAKRAYTRELADAYAEYFIPMYDIMTAEPDRSGTPKEELYQDGVHPLRAGHNVLALEIMKGLNII